MVKERDHRTSRPAVSSRSGTGDIRPGPGPGERWGEEPIVYRQSAVSWVPPARVRGGVRWYERVSETREDFIMITFLTLLTVLTTQCVLVSSAGCVGEEDVVVASSDYKYQPSCTNKHIGEALRANVGCRLVQTVVSLPWPNNTLVQQMTPTHISVSRCAGSCHGPGQTCLAREVSERRVEVMLGKCGVSVGTCDKECATVTVIDHLSCGCDCQLRSEDCSPQQVLRPEVCRCECRDGEGRRQCQEEGRAWSEDTCTCGCPLSLISQCAPGYQYDYNNTCSCLPTTALNQVQEEIILEEDVKRELDMFLGWEMILIIALGSLLIILSLIVVCLMIRLRTLRKKAACNTSLVPSTLSGQYFPCPDPCTDLTTQKNQKILSKPAQSSLSDSGSDRGKITDSSLCSEERDCHWTDSSESLSTVRNCQPVNLNTNLAIRSSPDTYTSYNNPASSNYNTVKIVYRSGEKCTELTCLMDPRNDPGQGQEVNITPNPLVYNM